MKSLILLSVLLVGAYCAATTDSSNKNPAWQWNVNSALPTTSYQNSAYWSFVKAFEDSNTNCDTATVDGLDWKQTTEDDAKFYKCLTDHTSWCKLMPDAFGEGAKVPISLSNCKHACYDLATAAATTGTIWKGCWDAANAKITLEAATMWTKLQFVSDFTWTAVPSTWAANSNYNYWLCAAHNGCWDENANMGLSENTEGASDLYFQAKRTNLITNWPASCPTAAATDPAAELSSSVATCLDALLPLTFTPRDRKTINCLSQCASPTGLFTRRFASTDVQSSKHDGENSMIDGEHVSRKAALIKELVNCVNKDWLFFQHEIQNPTPSQWHNDAYRKFSQFTGADNGMQGAGVTTDISDDRKKINDERARTRNCLFTYDKCENFRKWAKHSFQESDSLGDDLKNCIMDCTQIGTPKTTTQTVGTWIKYEQLDIHSGGNYWEANSTREALFKQAGDASKLMVCAQKFENDWNALIRELHAESSATILGAVIIGLIAFLF